jgi:glutathione S-transferase
MDFLLAAVNPSYLAAFKSAKHTPEEQSAESKEQIKDLTGQMAIVDSHLKGKDYFALGKFTIADIAYGPIMKRCLDFKIGRNAMPNLERWMAAIAARPSFKAATA